MQTEILDRLHADAHWDEFVAACLTTLSSKEIPEGERFGEGGGLFDEHLPDGERIEGECSATLVAKYLELDTDHRLAPLLQFTLETDEGSTQDDFDVAAAVNRFRRGFLIQTNKERQAWVEVAFGAYWQIVRDCKTPEEVDEALARARDYRGINFRASLEKNGVKHSKGMLAEKLRVMIERAEREATPKKPNYVHPWDTTAIARMIASVHGVETAMKWFDATVAAASLEDYEYHLAGREFDRHFRVTEVCGCRIAHGTTDSKLIGKFARAKRDGGCQIVIHRTTAGNIMISTNKHQILDGTMRTIVMAVKANEPGDPNAIWHDHKKAKAILNGSDSQPKPPTEQTLQQVVDTIVAVIRNKYE